MQARRGSDMTPARRKALQWFHDRGEVSDYELWYADDAPSQRMIQQMTGDGQLQLVPFVGLVVTDKGRRMLHGDDK